MKTLAILFCALALLACNKNEKSDTQSQGSATVNNAPVNPPTITSAPAAQNLSDIKTEEDFEDEAETEITPENYEKELSAIEKEIP